MNDIKAWIFDLDGVITDTAEYHYQAWKRLADEEGIEFTRQTNERLRGVSRRRSLEILLGDHLKRYDESQIVEMMERKNNYYKDLLTRISEKDILPGARELLGTLNETGMKIALGSASRNARSILSRLGILEKFDAVSDGYCVNRAKPEPDVFIYAAGKLGVVPEECVVVEDAEAGVEAALKVNMTVIGIGPEERIGRAHYHYGGLDELAIGDITPLTQDSSQG